MEFAELKTKNAKDLKEILAEKRAELFELQLKARGKQLKQFHKISDLKKLIARAMTILNNKAEVK